jgi:hypothetical protein
VAARPVAIGIHRKEENPGGFKKKKTLGHGGAYRSAREASLLPRGEVRRRPDPVAAAAADHRRNREG